MNNENNETPKNQEINPAPATPVIVADDLDPQLFEAFQAEAESAPPPVPLRTRRIEIRTRTGSFLRKLTGEQQDQLFRLLRQYSVPRVADLIAQPPPAGFGMRVQHTTLRRLRATLSTIDTEDAYENSALAADSLSETVDKNRIDFAPVTADLLLQKTFDLARNDAISSADLKEVVASFVKLRELDLKARRLQIQASRSHREASPQRHQVDLNIIPPARPVNQSPAVELQVLPRTEIREISDAAEKSEENRP